ncbi:MAG: hypothetical protein GC164_13150 [Phycisphaera sp.]|nr:hypothetical protein [Phycisphaera sp.]
MIGQTLEPWDSERCLHTALHKLLVYILEHGPRSDDAIQRYCLRIDELVALMPDDARLANARAHVEGLIDYLDHGDRTRAFVASLRQWQHSTDYIRQTFEWEQLPRKLVTAATQRAEYLLLHAQRMNYIERHDDPRHWRLTETGLDVVDRYWSDGPRGVERASK